MKPLLLNLKALIAGFAHHSAQLSALLSRKNIPNSCHRRNGQLLTPVLRLIRDDINWIVLIPNELCSGRLRNSFLAFGGSCYSGSPLMPAIAACGVNIETRLKDTELWRVA